MRILILDDDAELVATLGDVLKLEGHDVVTVTTLAEAQQTLADAGPFDVAVFDLNLQNDNAIGLLQEVMRRMPMWMMTMPAKPTTKPPPASRPSSLTFRRRKKPLGRKSANRWTLHEPCAS